MKPLIGITCELQPDKVENRSWYRTTLLTGYAEGIAAAGGLAVGLPLAADDTAGEILARLDGLILSGGLDIPAEALGEPPHPNLEPMAPRRWASERFWLETALDMEMPILGICLGMQVMGVVAGGALIQDIPSQWPHALAHTEHGGLQRHAVTLCEGTRLARFAPDRELTVTSSHHQAVRGAPPGFRLAALSPDGIVEAIERPDREFVVGVQWHPERNPDSPDWLLEAFVRRCCR